MKFVEEIIKELEKEIKKIKKEDKWANWECVEDEIYSDGYNNGFQHCINRIKKMAKKGGSLGM